MKMLRRLGVACAVACAIAFAPVASVLADAPASVTVSNTVVDLAPLINNVLVPLLLAVATVAVPWLGYHLKTWLGIQNNAALAGVVDKALTNGLGYAQAQLAGKIPSGPIPLDVKNEIVAAAANYAVGHVPDALKMLGVDQASLVQKLQARLEVNTTPPESNIAVVTPPKG